jgi:hypothetical protein
MRARMLAVMVTALVLLVAAPAVAGPREDIRARRQAMAEQARAEQARPSVIPKAIQNGETRENMEQVVANHFGSPAEGQALIQTWVEPDWQEFEAVDIQAAVQAVKVRRASGGFARRISIRVELYGDGVLQATSSTVNTGDTAGIAYVQTPEAGGLTDPARPCLWFSVAYYSIRWDDNALTSGQVLVAPGDWVNPTCLLTPATDLLAR